MYKMDNAFLYPTATVEDFYTWNKDTRFGGAAAIAFSPAGGPASLVPLREMGQKASSAKTLPSSQTLQALSMRQRNKRFLNNYCHLRWYKIIHPCLLVVQVLAEAEVLELKARNAQLEGMVETMIRVTTEANRVYEQGQEVSKRVQEKLRRENEKLRRACEQAQEEAKRAYQQAREELKAAQAGFLNVIKAGVKGLEQA